MAPLEWIICIGSDEFKAAIHPHFLYRIWRHGNLVDDGFWSPKLNGAVALNDVPPGAQGMHADFSLLAKAAATAGWPWSWPSSILSDGSLPGNIVASPCDLVFSFPSYFLHSRVIAWPPQQYPWIQSLRFLSRVELREKYLQ